MINGFRNIIWDWNGTLLNDRQTCVDSINVLLKRRELPSLTIEHYQEVFDFPVKEYYARIGFDFTREPFEIPANEFIAEYYHRVKHCSLHNDVTTILTALRQQGIRQFVLSAMEHASLEKTLTQQGILPYFEHISGLDNHHAASKAENGVQLMNRLQLNPAETCLIGDTTHDFEVANSLGCKCLLFSGGISPNDAWQLPEVRLSKLF